MLLASQKLVFDHYYSHVNETAFLQLISGRQQGVVPDLARFGLRCLAPFYATATRLRNAGYHFNVSTAHTADVPVVSVGNITTGGTGKTPIVGLLTSMLSDAGHRPCILSRGYRAVDELGNDEKMVLDRICPGVPHVQNPDRVAGATQAIQEFNPTVLVLDDGFQHRRLARDVDIVLIDATNPFGHEFVLPRGLLREPISGLHRADIIVVTRCDRVTEEELQRVEKRLRRYKKPIARVAFEPTELVRQDGSKEPLDTFNEQSIGAFCGIGNPEAFRSTLKQISLEPKFFEAFADHCHYDETAVRKLNDLTERHAVNRLLCTEKDIVKLLDAGLTADVFGVRIAPVLRTGSDYFDAAIAGVTETAAC